MKVRSDTNLLVAAVRSCSGVLIVVFLILGSPISSQGVLGQTFLLPTRSALFQGHGHCAGMVVGVHTKNWRVRKGDTFEVSAVRPQGGEINATYSWSVANGKIVSGQGSSAIRIKAGGAKTPGYINVSGFVRVTLLLERTAVEDRCKVTAFTSIMVGKNREVNQTPNVMDLDLDRTELRLPCDDATVQIERSSPHDMTVKVRTNALDPEMDPLSYNYAIKVGKIIGTGYSVMWDLTGAPPGEHTIQVGVDDGFGVLGRTESRVVNVTECKTFKSVRYYR